MRRALYPEEKYPHGHPHLATSLSNLGGLFRDEGEYTRARGYYEQALAMHQDLYPKDMYPHGHPHLAVNLSNLSFLLQTQGNYAGALAYSQQALDMYQGLTEILVPALSEGEALNYLTSLPMARDLFLSISRDIPDSDAGSYAQISRSKGALFRIVRSREQTLRRLVDPESRDL